MLRSMRRLSEYDTFTRAVDQILAVPKAEILRREAEYKKQADANPHKRGPKPKIKRKVKSSVSLDRVV
jgi:hypothetical protein